jgi:hypothetical protein
MAEYNIVAKFQIEASNEDEAWEIFEEKVANMVSEDQYLIDCFEVEKKK